MLGNGGDEDIRCEANWSVGLRLRRREDQTSPCHIFQRPGDQALDFEWNDLGQLLGIPKGKGERSNEQVLARKGCHEASARVEPVSPEERPKHAGPTSWLHLLPSH